MALKSLLISLGLTAAALPSPVVAQFADPPLKIPAAAMEDGKLYCMRLEPLTGTVVERVECWTRAQWADQGVDVDKEFPKNGVRKEG